MSTPDNQSWEKGPIGIVILLLVIFLIFAFARGRHGFRDNMHDAGQDLKAAGHDMSASIRDTVQ